jgi:hypothetical protein
MGCNALKNPEPIPRGTDCASTTESDIPIVGREGRREASASANAIVRNQNVSASEC